MNKRAKITKAAIYLRISDDKAGDELGVKRQREDAEQLCAARDWIATPYEDNDQSAKVADKRPAFRKLLADVESGEIGAVVAWSLDRLARNARDRLALVEACQKRGVVIALVQGSDMDPSTASGRMVIGVLGEVAQMEIELKGERQIRAARQRAEAGKAWTPVRWFGYTMPKPDGTGIEIVQSEAALLADAYDAILSGHSLMGIAKRWNALGVRTVKGNPWVAKVLRDVLLNPRNAGRSSYRGAEVGQGTWDPIVAEDVYRGVAAILKDPSRTRRPVNGYGRQYLLSGVVRCGKCDKTMTGSLSNNTTIPRAKYFCRHCGGTARSVPDVDAWVIGHVVDYLSRPETIALTAQQDSPQIAEMRLAKRALVGRQAELTAALTDPDMPIAEVKAAAAVIREKIAAINARLDNANNDRVLAGVMPDDDDRDSYYTLPADERMRIAQQRFDALSDDRKRAVIDKLCSVRILPGQPSRAAFRTDLVPVLPKA
ncbi:Ser_Recombinase domain containing protein [Mycobacteriaceae bacterium]